MSSDGEPFDSVKKAVAKLYVLRDSCTGIIEAEKSGKNLVWFQGAEAVLREALEVLQKLFLPKKRSFQRRRRGRGKTGPM